MIGKQQIREGTVAVLLGGQSAEREISLKTGRAVQRALESRNYRCVAVDPRADVGARLAEAAPVAAFVALHGRWGEDGCVQGLLECAGVPYTGSGVLASALGLDKVASKHLFASAGVPTPAYTVLPRGHTDSITLDDIPFGLPAVVKPAREGSSVGITIVRDEAEFARAVDVAAGYEGHVLVEQYVKGREVSVAVLDETALGAIEIVPARPFYDYEAKYGANSGTQYRYPAPLDSEVDARVHRLAEEAHRALGCAGVTRADFLVDGGGGAWLIEVNTLPGLTETSLVPKIAAGAGIEFEELCERVLLGASLKA